VQTVTQTVASDKSFYRARCAHAADWLAIAVAASLPWSTSASGILIALWFIAIVATLDVQSLRWSITIPAAAVSVALFALGVMGTAWSNASLHDQWGSIKPTLRLLALPMLFIQFRNSGRGIWVAGGFLVSCTVLLVVSWVLTMWPGLAPRDRFFLAFQ
jgi:hypothetical protein